MLDSLVSRFRVLTVILAFGFGLLGPVASNLAMAAQMQPASGGMASDHPCPACPNDQHSGITPMCSAVGCWLAPALPAHNAPAEPMQRTAFAIPPDVLITGIATAPDPYPPRLPSHA
jgi:hypothetical protein